jgi:hypothetical protein
MIRTTLLSALTAAAFASAACFDFSSKITAPSGTNAATAGLVGGWSSQGASLEDSCKDFKWSVTQTSGNTATGTFSATCFGNVAIAGSAAGSLNNNVLTWSATATAVVPNVTTCPINLSGTATLAADGTIQIPYTGTTCLGPVSGTQTLKK